MSNNRSLIVKLCNKTGKWVLIAGTMGSSAVAATSLPFADVPNRIVSMIRSVRDTLESNRELADSLGDTVVKCDIMMRLILDSLNHGDHSRDFETTAIPFLNKILDGFFQILDAISFRCEKWTNKNLPKKLWGSDKYAKEFTSLKKKLDDYMPILQCGVSVVMGQKMSYSLEKVKEGNARIEKIIGMAHEESTVFAEDMKQSLQAFLFEMAKLAEKMDGTESNLKHVITKTSQDSKEFTQDMINSLQRALEKKMDDIVAELNNPKITSMSQDSKVFAENEVQTLQHLLEEMDGMKAELKSLNESLNKKSQSRWSRFWDLSPSPYSHPGSIEGRVYITKTSITPEEEKLTVTTVKLHVDELTRGDTSGFFTKLVVVPQIASLALMPVAPGLGLAISNSGLGFCAVVMLGVRLGVGKFDFADKMARNCLTFGCHYWVTVTLSNGKQCTLERTAQTSDAMETCENLKTGVHLYWGPNSTRTGYANSDDNPNRTFDIRTPVVTVSDLLSFCRDERSKEYSAVSNNCKHFCHNLLQNIFMEIKGLSFWDFTVHLDFTISIRYTYFGHVCYEESRAVAGDMKRLLEDRAANLSEKIDGVQRNLIDEISKSFEGLKDLSEDMKQSLPKIIEALLAENSANLFQELHGTETNLSDEITNVSQTSKEFTQDAMNSLQKSLEENLIEALKENLIKALEEKLIMALEEKLIKAFEEKLVKALEEKLIKELKEKLDGVVELENVNEQLNNISQSR